MTTNASPARRKAATVLACTVVAVLAVAGGIAQAALVATVPLGSAADFAVLAGTTVTNTGPSTMDRNLGVSPDAAVTGFPPGLVSAPGTIQAATDVADDAQLDLTAAYVNAAGRPLDVTTTADLTGLTLQGGVYAGPSKSALTLSGELILDGADDPSTVFIFQTDSTLITGSSSTVTLINGAQECNVFWQVGSSATLGSGSTFRGNILALTSITVDTGVTVHGRALARNGAVTLDTDTFEAPTCVNALPTTTTTSTSTTSTTVASTTTTTGGGTTSTTVDGSTTSTTAGGGSTSTSGGGSGTGTGTGLGRGPGVPAVVGPPRTGGTPATEDGSPWPAATAIALAGTGLAGAVHLRRARASAPDPS